MKKRIASFGYAINGLKILIKEEHNARVHLFVSFIVLVLGVFLEISKTDWVFVFIAIGLVFIAELINSSIERLVDEFSLERNLQLGNIKDLSSAAVLISAGVSIIIGGYVFVPYLIRLL